MSNYIDKRLIQHFKNMIDRRISNIERRKEIHESTLLSLRKTRSEYPDYSSGLSSKLKETIACRTIIIKCNAQIGKLLYIKNILYVCDLKRVCTCLAECSYMKMTWLELRLHLTAGVTSMHESKSKNISFVNIDSTTYAELNIH